MGRFVEKYVSPILLLIVLAMVGYCIAGHSVQQRVSIETKNRPYEIKGLRVPYVSPMKRGKCGGFDWRSEMPYLEAAP